MVVVTVAGIVAGIANGRVRGELCSVFNSQRVGPSSN